MSSGWKYIRDDGQEYKNAIQAALSLNERPESTFEFSEIDMKGEHRRDATYEIMRLHKRKMDVS